MGQKGKKPKEFGYERDPKGRNCVAAEAKTAVRLNLTTRQRITSKN